MELIDPSKVQQFCDFLLSMSQNIHVPPHGHPETVSRNIGHSDPAMMRIGKGRRSIGGGHCCIQVTSDWAEKIRCQPRRKKIDNDARKYYVAECTGCKRYLYNTVGLLFLMIMSPVNNLALM